PISTEPKQAVEFLEAIRKIKTLGKVNFTCGLSNISFGLPHRQVVNAVFLSMAMANGLNSAIIDPLNKLMMASIYTAESILGQDEYCMNYITKAREGKLEI
ncbi:MAG: dihydropteroate synthase, partial [Candidatus Omnitrophica bacterium]|nr:dihydropteroate synthase [Candidatus Omnitrophota bacterium]